MHSINNDKDCFLIAGTAANVISFLALMGVDSYFLQPHYRGRDGVWLNLAMEQRKIKVIDYSSSSNDAPRIIEHLDKGKHSFKTVCPLCGKKMLELKLPQVNHVKKLGINISEYNLFFYDRISDGIKWIAELNVRGWNFYEPNSFRNYEVFCTNSKTADILKISKERCSDKYIERLKNDLNLGKTMLFIVSLGAEGVKYSYKNAEGKMSDWVYIGSNCSDFVVDSTGAGDWMTAVFM